MVLINEMSKIPGEKIIEEILQGDEKVLTKVYKKVYRAMEHYCLKTGGTPHEAKEAVQDAFEQFYRQILGKRFELTSNVETYIIAMAKNLHHKKQRDWNNRIEDDVKDFEVIDDKDENEPILYLEKKQQQLFWEEFNKLKRGCRTIIKLTIQGLSSKQIAKKLKLGSDNYVKTKRARCKNELINNIKNNPEYEKLSNTNPEDIELFIR